MARAAYSGRQVCCCAGDVRKLSKYEMLGAFGFTPQERQTPALARGGFISGEGIAQTIAPNVFEAVIANMLHVMGIRGPREELQRRLGQRGLPTAAADAIQVVQEESKYGIKYETYKSK